MVTSLSEATLQHSTRPLEGEEDWRQSQQRKLSATSGGGFDAGDQISLRWSISHCNGPGQAGREEAHSMLELWDSLSVDDTVQQGSVFHIPVQLSKLW